jgi:hypothetical protein
VQARPEGGYTVANTPNPNSGRATFDRGQADSINPLGDNIGLMQRGMANRMISDYADSTQPRVVGAPSRLSTVLPDARWEGFKQALYERGVGRLTTTATRKQGSPGYFDQQDATPSYAEQLAAQGKQFHGFGKAVTDATDSDKVVASINGLKSAAQASKTAPLGSGLLPNDDPYASDIPGSSKAWITEQKHRLGMK